MSKIQGAVKHPFYHQVIEVEMIIKFVMKVIKIIIYKKKHNKSYIKKCGLFDVFLTKY